MKKGKLIFWLIILGFFVLLGFQNKTLFIQMQTLGLDLYVIEQIETPELSLAVFFACFFLVGLVIAYFFSLYAKFKSNQMIKGLNQKIDSFVEKISKLEEENASLKTAIMGKSPETMPPESPASVGEQTADEQMDPHDAVAVDKPDANEVKS